MFLSTTTKVNTKVQLPRANRAALGACLSPPLSLFFGSVQLCWCTEKALGSLWARPPKLQGLLSTPLRQPTSQNSPLSHSAGLRPMKKSFGLQSKL